MATYRRLQRTDEVAELLQTSKDQPVLFFKHSLTCPISLAAFREYESFLADRSEDGILYTLVEIQNARDVSNEIAAQTEVRHESPQAILLRQGEVAWHASHWKIKSDALASAVDG